MIPWTSTAHGVYNKQNVSVYRNKMYFVSLHLLNSGFSVDYYDKRNPRESGDSSSLLQWLGFEGFLLVWLLGFDQKIRERLHIPALFMGAKFCPANSIAPSWFWGVSFGTVPWKRILKHFRICSTWDLWGSLMKQEYLQVHWKSGVKQSSGFGACAINTINNIINKGFLRKLSWCCRARCILFKEIELVL